MSAPPPRLQLPPCRSHLKVCQSKASTRSYILGWNPQWAIAPLPWGKPLCFNCSGENRIIEFWKFYWERRKPPHGAHVENEWAAMTQRSGDWCVPRTLPWISHNVERLSAWLDSTAPQKPSIYTENINPTHNNQPLSKKSSRQHEIPCHIIAAL